MAVDLKSGLLFAALAVFGHAQTAPVRDAIADMQRGDFPSAERKLRGETTAHPDDALALSLLGATLDSLHRIPEAGSFHDRAVAKAPRSPDVVSNYAAHLWMAGREAESRKVYERVLGLDASHYAANLQLARAALKGGSGSDTLRYLDHLSPQQRDAPQVLLLRLEGLYLSGDGAAADKLFARLSQMSQSDMNLGFALATSLMNARQFDKAEAFCEAALRADPTNFTLLYDLGVVASYAGHYDRAREVLETALSRQPQNVDVLYALGRAHEAAQQWEAAIRPLAQAARLDPRRADVQKMLALVATELGALEDAAAAWDRYLKLEPTDDTARRERSYLSAQMGKLEEGIAGLELFLKRHPDDVVGHYELGQAQRSLDTAKSFAHFDKALERDPKYAPARAARGSLYYQEGKPEAAVKDLEITVSLRPDDAESLDRLGQAYAGLDRTADAVRVLRRAAELAPDDSKILLHYGRALADAGNSAESKAVMDRFRSLGPEKKRTVPAGLVDYLGMTEEQRRADYRARVEQEFRAHPDNPTARLAALKLLVEDGQWDKAAEVAGGVPDSNLAEAGRVLLAAGQVSLAQKLFERMPGPARPAEYPLALVASGKAEAVEPALGAAPARPDYYVLAAAILTQTGHAAEALRFLEQGARALPDNRDVLLLRACALELAGQTADAGTQLTELERRWPEWYAAWLAHGMIGKAHGRREEAQAAFGKATSLGAPAKALDLDVKGILAGALFR